MTEKWAEVTDRATGHLDLMNGFLHQASEFMVHDFHDVFALTESPIESVLLKVMSCRMLQCVFGLKYRVDGRTFGIVQYSDHFLIEPQAAVGTFRVDFLVEYHGTQIIRPSGDWDDDTAPAQFVPVTNRLIVECDGHDFHERTKEQAKKDKSRDRALKMAGYEAFHFTGSEIWGDPLACSDSVLEFLCQNAKHTP